MNTSDHGSDRAIDLSPLDPENDPTRLERVVANVLEHLGPGVVEDSASLAQQVAQAYARGFRPLFVAASLVAVAAGFQLVRSGNGPADPQEVTAGQVAPSGAWTSWLDTGIPPTTEELLFSFASEDR